MERICSIELENNVGNNVLVSGWVQDLRSFGNLMFIILKDRNGKIQITLPKKVVGEELFKQAESLTKESVVSVLGEVKKSDKSQTGFEIIPSSLEIVSLAEAPVPLDVSGKIESDLSSRLDYRFLDLRNEKSIALFKIRSKMFKLVCNYFDKKDFININTPKITSTGVESGAELFKVDYFGKPAFLSQSPQIYKQMMVAAGFEKVYELGVVFRAEKSHTTRHLTEFTGIDFEQGFIKDEHQVMDTLEEMLVFMLKGLKEETSKELDLLGKEIVIPKEKFPRIQMQEARDLLEKEGKKVPENEDLDAEAEKMLSEIIKKKFNSEFVFVYDYPWEKRPFYHMKPEGKTDSTKSFDLIWNGVEICTGAQREHRYEILKAQAKEKGVNLDEMKDYANIFKYGCPPHGGAGIGLDRLVECFLELDNIREGILLPRDPERLTP